MKVAILGAGFSGLAAGLRLLQQGHEVTIFEKEAEIGGLAAGFKEKSWNWTLEKAYHHWFTNDNAVLNLAKELNYPVIIKRPSTDVYINNDFKPFDSPLALLALPYLPLLDRIRTGLFIAFLKFTSNPEKFAGQRALPWLRKFMGQRVTDLIWEPLFRGKFGDFKESVALSWFWARIYKRTPSLAYPEGGFKALAERLAAEVKRLGGVINLNTEILKLKSDPSTGSASINTHGKNLKFDKVVVTLPSPIFAKITPQLPKNYVKRITSIPHLSALNLILVSKKPLLEKTYWLNITQNGFPFLVIAEHTNFMDKSHYNKQHLTYIGNYLPPDHRYFKMSAKEIIKEFAPYLKKINPNYQLQTTNCYLFPAPFAQPVVGVNYLKLIPTFKSPLKNIYVANLDMVYPWDRGTNYAVELGEKVAREVNKNNG